MQTFGDEYMPMERPTLEVTVPPPSLLAAGGAALPHALAPVSIEAATPAATITAAPLLGGTDVVTTMMRMGMRQAHDPTSPPALALAVAATSAVPPPSPGQTVLMEVPQATVPTPQQQKPHPPLPSPPQQYNTSLVAPPLHGRGSSTSARALLATPPLATSLAMQPGGSAARGPRRRGLALPVLPALGGGGTTHQDAHPHDVLTNPSAVFRPASAEPTNNPKLLR